MAGNTFGSIFRLTTFGESHGPAIGGILDGCPAGLPLTEDEIQHDLDLRKPGSGGAATSRKETDKVALLSGVFAGKTTGTPIAFLIHNEDQRSRDYGNLASCFRPGHADWSYHCKYKGNRDYRGGGRASGRETAIRVAAGAVAKKLLATACGAKIYAGTIALGNIAVPEFEINLPQSLTRPYFAAADAVIALWDKAVQTAREKHDTLGGIIQIEAENIPAGLGEPVFDKLDARLAFALMSVGAVKGVEVGAGFRAAGMYGSQNNDAMLPGAAGPQFQSNNAGGILGGVSTGQPIILRAAIKPIASIPQIQNTVDINGNATQISIAGRHDLAAIPRAVPVLGAMTALVLADALLLQQRMTVLP